MQFIADQTGGLAITNTNDLNLGISRVLQRPGKAITFSDTRRRQGAPRSGWDQNRVKVRVKRPGLRVRARQGFFGPVRSERAERLRIRSADDCGSLAVCVERRHRAAHVVLRT